MKLHRTVRRISRQLFNTEQLLHSVMDVLETGTVNTVSWKQQCLLHNVMRWTERQAMMKPTLKSCSSAWSLCTTGHSVTVTSRSVRVNLPIYTRHKRSAKSEPSDSSVTVYTGSCPKTHVSHAIPLWTDDDARDQESLQWRCGQHESQSWLGTNGRKLLSGFPWNKTGKLVQIKNTVPIRTGFQFPNFSTSLCTYVPVYRHDKTCLPTMINKSLIQNETQKQCRMGDRFQESNFRFKCFFDSLILTWSHNSVVGTVTNLGYGLPRNYGSIPGRDKKCFSTSKASRLPLGPSNLLLKWYCGLFHEVKGLEREAKQSGK
jgi:hypothetical protein